MIEYLLRIDTALFLFFNQTLSIPFLDNFFIITTEAKYWIIPSLVAAIFFIRKERKKALIVIGISFLTVAISDPLAAKVLKPFFSRPRPCHPDFFVEGGRFLIGMKKSFSFPSNHATNMFGQAIIFSYFYPKRTVVFVCFATFIAYTRVVTGVHYPLDVAGGAVLGVLCGYLSIGFFLGIKQLISTKLVKRSSPHVQTGSPIENHASTSAPKDTSVSSLEQSR
jgi:undecaprenyl-diphosphatase